MALIGFVVGKIEDGGPIGIQMLKVLIVQTNYILIKKIIFLIIL